MYRHELKHTASKSVNASLEASAQSTPSVSTFKTTASMSSPSDIMQLQKTIGNRATYQLLNSHNSIRPQPSQPIQRTVIKQVQKETMTPRQLGYKFFGKYEGEIKDSLDQLKESEFDTIKSFLEAAIKLNPNISADVDKKYVENLKKDLMIEAALNAEPLKQTPKFSSAAVDHAYKRHTYEGIRSVRKILSAATGDTIAIFQEGFGYGDLEVLAHELESINLTWTSKGGGRYDAVTPNQIKIQAQLIGSIMEVDSFFPLNNSISREEAEKLTISK